MIKMDTSVIDWQNPDSIWHAHPSNHRLVPGGTEYERYLFVRNQIPRAADVLDVGCNCGQLSVNLTQDLGCRCTGVDIVADFIQNNRRNKAPFGPWYCMDFSRVDLAELEAKGLGPAKFDVVTALEVIEHPIDVRGFRERVNFVLRPGGKLVITTPHPDSPSGGYKYFRQHPHHVRVWTAWRLESVFGPIEVYQEINHKGQLAQIGATFVLKGE